MSSHDEHSRRWTSALTSSVDAALDRYAEDFSYDDHADRDHVLDTAITKAELAPKIGAYSNTDPRNGLGIHRFEVLESYPVAGVNGNPSVVTRWTWTGSGLDTYRGVATGGRQLSTTGITWHQLDADGKIVREQTYWNDTPVLQELGIPIITPRYWEAGFDPASLTG